MAGGAEPAQHSRTDGGPSLPIPRRRSFLVLAGNPFLARIPEYSHDQPSASGMVMTHVGWDEWREGWGWGEPSTPDFVSGAKTKRTTVHPGPFPRPHPTDGQPCCSRSGMGKVYVYSGMSIHSFGDFGRKGKTVWEKSTRPVRSAPPSTNARARGTRRTEKKRNFEGGV